MIQRSSSRMTEPTISFFSSNIVDDILAGSTASPIGSRLLQEFIDLFTKTFNVKNLGDAKKFLSLHIQQDLTKGTVRLDQIIMPWRL